MNDLYITLLAEQLKKTEQDLSEAWLGVEEAYKLDPKITSLILDNWDDLMDLMDASFKTLRELQYPSPEHLSISEVLVWVSWFVHHEIHDDGNPRVLWGTRTGQKDNWKSCDQDKASRCFILQDDYILEGELMKTHCLNVDNKENATLLESALVFQRSYRQDSDARSAKFYADTGRTWVPRVPSPIDTWLKQILQHLKKNRPEAEKEGAE